MNTLFGGPEARERRRARWRLIHVAELICLTTGLICLGWVGWNYAATAFDQSWAEYELNASLRGDKPSLRGYIEELKSAPSAEQAEPRQPEAAPEPPPRPAPPIRLPKGATVGRIEIPRLGIAAVVKAGADEKTLSRAVGHVPGTALPGQPGNIGIAAHRDTFFRNLSGVKVGDTIRMTTTSGTWDYRVESTNIVRPKNVEVLDPTPEPAITLVTCYPFNFVGHAPKRFIVRATQITPPTEEQQRAAMLRPATPEPLMAEPASAKKKSGPRSARLGREPSRSPRT